METQTTKTRRLVKTKENKLGFIYENDFIESAGIDKIPVYVLSGGEPTGEKLLCNPGGLELIAIH